MCVWPARRHIHTHRQPLRMQTCSFRATPIQYRASYLNQPRAHTTWFALKAAAVAPSGCVLLSCPHCRLLLPGQSPRSNSNSPKSSPRGADKTTERATAVRVRGSRRGSLQQQPLV